MTPHRPFALRLVEWTVVTAVVVALAVYLSRGWTEVRSHPWSLDWVSVLFGSAFVVIAYTGFVLLWRRLLLSLGGRLSVRDAHRVWYFGNLARYIPGKVLQLAGTAYLARAKGVSPVLTVSSSITSQLFVIGTAIVVAALSLPAVVGTQVEPFRNVGIAVTVVFALVVLTPAFNRFYRMALHAVGRDEYYVVVPLATRVWLVFGYAAAWVLLGIGFFLFLDSITPVGRSDFWPLIGTCAAGYAAGWLAVFTPGGLGVREGVYALLIALYVPPSVAVATAILVRLWFTACELLVAGLLAARYGIADLRASAGVASAAGD